MSFVTFNRLGFMGELGNQMFQVASVIGYARKHGKDPIFPRWTCKIGGIDYSEIFEYPVDQSLSYQMVNEVRNNFVYEDLKYKDIPYYDGNLNLVGYFQSELYFEHCVQEIRKIFSPSLDIRRYIEDRYHDVISDPNKVSLHVRTARRGANDYDVHSAATREFIEKSQSHFSEDTTYVVFADNMTLAKQMLPDRKYIFIENEPNYIDLFLMNYFSSYIVSPSTFGWWGAWLSQDPNPKVVIMKDWFVKDKAKAYLNNNDIIPERWKKIYL